MTNKTKRILEELQHRAKSAREIFEEIFPHNPDKFKVTKRLLGYMTPPKKLTYKELRRLEQKRFYTLIAKLNKQGIVKKQGISKRILWNLTINGRNKLDNFSKQKSLINIPKRTYKKEKTSDSILIIFDIPETLKHYRNWIRSKLAILGFEMLQKSVWIGNYQIPSEFIHDLREANLLKYIHIFRVTKGGSLLE